mmetsp:Transcript_35471/g.85578  ORF Transcript_35471/g.85578 Transcript_35471/m.85578 type:complete len:200 (-) Transcript_35471:523-1122(-)
MRRGQDQLVLKAPLQQKNVRQPVPPEGDHHVPPQRRGYVWTAPELLGQQTIDTPRGVHNAPYLAQEDPRRQTIAVQRRAFTLGTCKVGVLRGHRELGHESVPTGLATCLVIGRGARRPSRGDVVLFQDRSALGTDVLGVNVDASVQGFQQALPQLDLLGDRGCDLRALAVLLLASEAPRSSHVPSALGRDVLKGLLLVH